MKDFEHWVLPPEAFGLTPEAFGLTTGAADYAEPTSDCAVYVAGSLRNPQVPIVANMLRANGFEVFDDWYGTGPRADEHWQDYEKARGRSYKEALNGYAARNIFELDTTHIRRCQNFVLVLPTGKSGHMELGFAHGLGKKTYALFDGEPERYDVMYHFANRGVFFSAVELLEALKKETGA